MGLDAKNHFFLVFVFQYRFMEYKPLGKNSFPACADAIKVKHCLNRPWKTQESCQPAMIILFRYSIDMGSLRV